MIKKKHAIIMVVTVLILSVAVTLFVYQRYFEEEFENYDEYLEFKEKYEDGVIVSKEEAAYIQDLAESFYDAYAVEKVIKDNFYKDTDEVDFSDGAIRGVVASLNDPYSYYYSPDEMSKLEESMTSDYVGIGVVVSPTEDGYITVVSPFEGSPGALVGLQPLDKIVAIEGVKVYGEDLQYAVEQMRGEAGTKVTATIQRGDEVFDVTIERALIEVDTVASEMLEGNIGYIRISQFALKTGEEFKTHYDELNKQNMQGLVLDLRSNPGGELRALMTVADLLLDKQVVLTMENKEGEISSYESDHENRFDKPIVVLVNEGSASASEALTGAIKDTGSGTVVGKKTFGKGVAQSVIPLKNGGALNLTTAEYFTPNGTNLNNNGIDPDIEVEFDFETDEDEQLDAALEEMRRQLNN